MHMKKNILKNPSFWISALGLIALAVMYALWIQSTPHVTLPGRISALASCLLFAAMCIRFVPKWMKFWKKSKPDKALRRVLNEKSPEVPWHMDLRIFITLLLVDIGMIALVFMIRKARGVSETFLESLEFWKCLDSASYLDIARGWYPSSGEQVVQLVFFPGYPLAIQLMNTLVGDLLLSGMIVSALSFAGTGCVLYRLVRLDGDHADGIRALKYLCILPGVFFYAAPMTESLFILLCASCIYCARTGKWTLGCLLGGLAAFTRSVGIILIAPLAMELIRAMRKGRRQSRLFWAGKWAALLLVAAGLGAYLYINYSVSGDPFKFREYQSSHWGQRLGYFFHTAAYQLENAITSYTEKPYNFMGLWLPNLIATFGSLIVMTFAAKKLRPSYMAWFIAYFAFAIGATWLLSAPRYLMAAVPVPLAFATLAKNQDVDTLLTPCLVGMSLLYTYAFVARWQVW